MKKLLTLVLALVLSAFGTLLPSGLAERDAMTLILMDPGKLPAGSYSSLGQDRFLACDSRDSSIVIHDLRTGTTIPVTAREEDKDFWADAYFALMAIEGEVFSAKEIASYRAQHDASSFFRAICSMEQPRVWTCGDRYAILYSPTLLLDTHTGVTFPLPDPMIDSATVQVTTGDKLLFWNGSELRLHDPQGPCLHAAAIAYEGYLACCALPVDNDVFVLLMSDSMQDNARQFRCVLLDQTLQTREVIELGSYCNNSLSVYSVHRSSTGRLLLQTMGTPCGTRRMTKVSGKIQFVIEPAGPYLDNLLVIDPATGDTFRAAEDLPGLPHICGLSADGRCALIGVTDPQPLYRLNLNSLVCTEQRITLEIPEHLAADYQNITYSQRFSLPLEKISWSGGEYVIGPSWVFRVQQ